MTERQACKCGGIRFCYLCRNSDRVRTLLKCEVKLTDPGAVISQQNEKQRTSSFALVLLGEPDLSFCVDCQNIFESSITIRSCAQHRSLPRSNLTIAGLYVVRDFLSPKQESDLVVFFDDPSPYQPWKESQSGRRVQEYGPQKNFKKKKLSTKLFLSMPVCFEDIFFRVKKLTESLTEKPYKIAEVSVLEYMRGKWSNFDPHIDDTWLWGERIAGINLLEDCCMTFVNNQGITFEVYLPQRCFFLMSGDCRYAWMHAIRPQSVINRRISLTIRELSEAIQKENETAYHHITAAAKNFV